MDFFGSVIGANDLDAAGYRSDLQKAFQDTEPMPFVIADRR